MNPYRHDYLPGFAQTVAHTLLVAGKQSNGCTVVICRLLHGKRCPYDIAASENIRIQNPDIGLNRKIQSLLVAFKSISTVSVGRKLASVDVYRL